MAGCSDSHSFHRRPGLTAAAGGTGFITIARSVAANQASRSPLVGGYCPLVGGDHLLPSGRGEEMMRELGEQHLIPAEVLHNRRPYGDGHHLSLPLPYPFPPYYPYSNHHLYYPASVGWSGQIADRSIVAAAAESRCEAEHICISVPHRGTPKYSTRRRHTGNRISRRRSLSHSSMASALSSGDRYQVPHAARHQQIGVSPSPSCITMGASEQNNYGTLRRYPAECVRISHPGFEENIPRILVIPRGPKGFGFILRGANPATQDVNYAPTPEMPALQFFEGVDMTGPAMQAGLRPGDFLLAINGVDVRCASHEQVVDLIHQSGDTISLKVITVNPQAAPNTTSQTHYATGYGTLMRRRNSSSSVRTEGGGLPPLPPQRHPTTSLSFGRGAPFSNDETDCSTTDYQPLPLPPPSQQQVNYSSLTSAAPLAHPHPHPHQQQLINEGTHMEEIGGGSGLINHVHNPRLHQQHADYSVRCASVKARPSAARRISAAELEHLMIRQSASGGGSGVGGAGPSQFQPIQIQSSESTPHMSAAAVANGGPKKLAELKRKKQRGCAANASTNVPSSSAAASPESKSFPLKSFNSSPELLQYPPPTPHSHSRQPSTDSNGNYSRPFRPTLRPKTPPPPPPAYPPTANEQAPLSSSSVVGGPSLSANATPAPPPPPPPPNLLKQPQAHLKSAESAVVKSASASAITDPKAADCRGISADALQSVRLKPTKTVVKGMDLKASLNNSSNVSPQRPTEPNAAKASSSSAKKPADFDMDLRSALARRRSKVCADEEATTSSSGNTSSGDDKDSKGQLKSRARLPGPTQTPQTTNATNQLSSIGSASSSTTGNQPNGSAAQLAAATVGRYGGLSLRESVRENVQPVGGAANKSQTHHSPPSGFVINKKDSGYTSSRTSLEPSECGDDTHQHPHHHLGVKNSSSSSANTLVEEAGTTIRIPVDDSMNSAGATPTATSPPSPSRGPSDLLLSAGAQAHRVTLISKQLEDCYGTDRRVVVAAGKSSGVSAFKVVAVSSEQSRETTPRPLFLEDPTRTPAVDYEDVGMADKADSGHGDSDQDGTASGSIQLDETGNTSSATTMGSSNMFMTKKLVQWSTVDVAEWLCHLQLHDYVASFSSNQVTGKELAAFDRAKFTQLGVTRISHRQTMEQSLQRDYA